MNVTILRSLSRSGMLPALMYFNQSTVDLESSCDKLLTFEALEQAQSWHHSKDLSFTTVSAVCRLSMLSWQYHGLARYWHCQSAELCLDLTDGYALHQ